MSAATAARRNELFDYAVNHPKGFTVDDLMQSFPWTHRQVNEAIHDLRHFFGESGDTINLVCDPQSSYDRWIYRLVGDLDSMRPWTNGRVRDAEARVRTMKMMMSSIVAGTDGRSMAGRKARVMERAFQRLIEDLDTIMGVDVVIQASTQKKVLRKQGAA